MIAIIDSGVANFASVEAALARLGANAQVTADPAVIRGADRVILPGVGAANAAMSFLTAKGLVPVIQSLTQPVLGICLGMQIMFTHTEEGDQDGLRLIDGQVRRLLSAPDQPVPHMGWNQLTILQPDSALLRGVNSGERVYFVHSYAAPVAATTLASASYGADFSAIVQHRNFMGCQFHPERSGAVGARILKNFLEL